VHVPSANRNLPIQPEDFIHGAQAVADVQPAQDAVLKGLEAAREAIHRSLAGHTGGHENDALSAPVVQSFGVTLSSPLHDVRDEADVTDGVGLGNVGLQSAEEGRKDLSLLHNAESVGTTDVVKGISPAVSDVSQTITTLISGPAIVANTLIDGVERAASQVAGQIDQALALAPVSSIPSIAQPVVSAVEAVTVSSLHGVGVDSLAGLLQPSTASPVHIVPDDAAMLIPIGLDNVIHDDAIGHHAGHALLPMPGTGLI
jgi:hypothetical protein